VAIVQTGVNKSLREPETVKVYEVNRYVDAGDPRIMHERHAVYRLEEQPTWVTRPPKDRNGIILGPIVGLRKPEYAPEPMPDIFPPSQSSSSEQNVPEWNRKERQCSNLCQFAV
jgi:hypothetical protein